MKTSWRTKTIGDVCELINGGTPKTDVAEFWGGEHLWITPAEMGKRQSPYAATTARTLTALGMQNSSATPLPPLSVILSSRAPIGHLVINTEPMAFNQGCKGLIPGQSIDHKFLFYYLGSIIQLLNDLGTGTTFKELSGGKLKEVPIPVPPLAEQKRIVAILDEAFAGIAAATANAEKNLANARELFERYLNSVFAESAKGWVTRRLGDVFEIGSSKRILETEWTSSGVPFYGGKEIVKLARFGSVTSNAYISEEKYHEYASKYDMPRQGDILMTARGTIGTGYVVRENDRFYYKDGNIISLREKTPTDPDFVLYAFRSSVMADQLGQLTGTTVSHLPIQKAKTLILKMPDFARQKSIASNIRELEKEITNLEELYRRKLAALSSLKQSILQKAFSGDLTGIKTRHCEAA